MFWFETVHPDTGKRLTVEAVYVRPRKGRRDAMGLPMEPDEPEAVMVSEVRGCDGYVVCDEDIMNIIEAAARRCLERGM